MRKLFVAAALLTGLGMAGAAQAVTYDLAADFGNAVFSYGTGTGATGFTAYANSYTGCFSGPATFVCQNNSGSSSAVPTVGANQSSSAYTFNSPAITVPGDTVFMHPDNGTGATDTVLRFTAQTTGSYTLSGLFARIDSTASGTGTVASIYDNGASIFTATLDPVAGYPAGTPFVTTLALNAGDVLSFVVNNNGGDYSFDSTGLSGTIALNAVPEAATWAMMLAGFGLVGAAMRRNRRTTVTFA